MAIALIAGIVDEHDAAVAEAELSLGKMHALASAEKAQP
jgi:hypothetical protein